MNKSINVNITVNSIERAEYTENKLDITTPFSLTNNL